MPRKNHPYIAIIEPAPEGGFVVSIPELPGCISQGETFEEVERNIQDAVKGYISVLKEDGDFATYNPEFILSINRAESDVRAGNVKRLTSFRDLRR